MSGWLPIASDDIRIAPAHNGLCWRGGRPMLSENHSGEYRPPVSTGYDRRRPDEPRISYPSADAPVRFLAPLFGPATVRPRRALWARPPPGGDQPHDYWPTIKLHPPFQNKGGGVRRNQHGTSNKRPTASAHGANRTSSARREWRRLHLGRLGIR